MSPLSPSRPPYEGRLVHPPVPVYHDVLGRGHRTDLGGRDRGRGRQRLHGLVDDSEGVLLGDGGEDGGDLGEGKAGVVVETAARGWRRGGGWRGSDVARKKGE